MVIYYVLRPVFMLDNILLILLRICYTFLHKQAAQKKFIFSKKKMSILNFIDFESPLGIFFVPYNKYFDLLSGMSQ